MDNKSNNLIEYNGISTYLDSKISNFNQFNISSTLYIASQNKDISQITRVWIESKFIDMNIINTPKGKSYEGQILTGKKIFIFGELDVKIEYLSNDDSQSIQFLYCKVPACTDITIEEDFNESSSVYPSFKIEDIHCEKIDSRRVYLSVIVVAIADIF